MTSEHSMSLGHVGAAVAAGVGAGWLLRKAMQERGEWRVLGDKSGGAHAPMMISRDGEFVLKPLDQGERSSVEVEAYHKLRRFPIQPFLCGFHGTRRLNGFEYMQLDSAYHGMQGPCATLDIKIGKKTWDDHAKPEKIAKESKKFDEVYSASSAAEGFRIAGMKAGDLQLNAKNLKARFSLKTHEFGDWALPAFFANGQGSGPLPAGVAGSSKPDTRGCTVDMEAAKDVLKRLKVFQSAAEMGYRGTLRASSLLFTREMKEGGKFNMVLIDLAHYTPNPSLERDDNFCDGLANLIRTWEAWCEK